MMTFLPLIVLLGSCESARRTQASLPEQWRAAGVSLSDAEQILKRSLELAVAYKLTDNIIGGSPPRIPIRDQGLAPLPLPGVGEVSFVYCTDSDLTAAANAQEGYFYHLEVRKVKRVGKVVSVELVNVAQSPDLRPVVDGFARGIIIAFVKTATGWRAESHHSWIS